MRIKKLKLKNVRSYEEEEIEFPETSLLLSGNVGSGKTTILLAIEYALFGLQAGQKGSSLIRNNTNKAEVTLECEISGREIIIERRLKREKKSVTNDYSAITIDGDKREYATTELKSKILEILGYPSEFLKKNNTLYRYTVYTPQEHMKAIILEDPDKRLSILRYVFGVDKYKKIRENLTTVLGKLKEESKELHGEVRVIEEERVLLESTNSRLDILKEKIDNDKRFLEDRKENRKSIEKEISQVIDKLREREKAKAEIEKTKVLLTSKIESVNLIDREREEIERELAGSKEHFNEEEYLVLLKDLDSKRKALEVLNSSLIKLMASIRTIQQNAEDSVSKKERIFSIDICPTCLQDVSSSHKHNIIFEVEKEISATKKQESLLEREKEKISGEILQVKREIQGLENRKSELELARSREADIKKAREKLTRLDNSKAQIKTDLELLEKHVQKMKEQSLALSSFENIHNKKNEDFQKAVGEERRSEITLAESVKELELTTLEAERLTTSLARREISRKKLSNLLELIDWLSNHFLALVNLIERQVMLKLREEFSQLFSSWFNMITDDSFEVQLDENFTPLIIHDGTEMEYQFLSGGERTAVALAYRLALTQTINSVYSTLKTSDILILDEPTEGFSTRQVDKIRDVLDELKIGQLMMVSHESKMETFVDSIISVSKEGNASSISNVVGDLPKTLNMPPN